MSDTTMFESTQESTMEDDGKRPGKNRLCVIGNVLRVNNELLEAIRGLDVPVVFSEDGHEFFESTEYNTAFVVEDFDSEIFGTLHKSGHIIFGHIAIQQYFHQKQNLSRIPRPLYCTAMRNVTVCFTGFRKLDELTEMINLVHHMGGKVKKDFKPFAITHLVANSTSGDKYRYAVTA